MNQDTFSSVIFLEFKWCIAVCVGLYHPWPDHLSRVLVALYSIALLLQFWRQTYLDNYGKGRFANNLFAASLACGLCVSAVSVSSLAQTTDAATALGVAIPLTMLTAAIVNDSRAKKNVFSTRDPNPELERLLYQKARSLRRNGQGAALAMLASVSKESLA